MTARSATVRTLRRGACLRVVGVSFKVGLSGSLGLLYTLAALLVPEEPIFKRIVVGVSGLAVLALAAWSIARPVLRVRRMRRAGHDHRCWTGGRRGVD